MPAGLPVNNRTVIECLLVLVFAAAICLPGLFSRAITYDEAITLLQTAGNSSAGRESASEWPASPQLAGELKSRLYGHPSLAEVARELREGDVHPPLYYWALVYWRHAFGPSLETARALSLLFSIVAVGLVYAFCAVGGVKHPVIPSLTFALTSSAVDQAQQARSYSMGLALLCAAALVAAALWRRDDRNSTHRYLGFAIIAVLCCASFLTNYLTLFPVIVIVLWLAAVLQSGRWALIVVSSAIGLATVGLWASSLAAQLGARPQQDAGMLSFGVEIAYQLVAYASNLISPTLVGDAQPLAVAVGISAAAGLGALSILRTKNDTHSQFLALVWAWTLASSVGVITLNVLFDKHLTAERYLVFSVPALTILITQKVGQYHKPLQSLAYFMTALLWATQLFCMNWGYELSGPRRADRYRSLAKIVESVGTHNSVLVSGIEHGEAVPASLVYELPATLPVVFVHSDSDPAAIADVLDRYEYVWQVPAGGPTATVEEAVSDNLLVLGRRSEPAPASMLFRRP